VNPMRNLDDVRPACAYVPVDVFHQAEDESNGAWQARQREALALCAGCPIRLRCLEDALRHPAVEQHGVAGGMTAGARRRLLQERRRAVAA